MRDRGGGAFHTAQESERMRKRWGKGGKEGWKEGKKEGVRGGEG